MKLKETKYRNGQGKTVTLLQYPKKLEETKYRNKQGKIVTLLRYPKTKIPSEDIKITSCSVCGHDIFNTDDVMKRDDEWIHYLCK
jgi:hypothetical protein